MAERDAFLVALGQRVRQVRLATNLTQEQLADRAGLSTKYISEVESGAVNPSIGVINTLAINGLRISLPGLLNFTLDPQQQTAAREEIVGLIDAQPPDAQQRALLALRAFFAQLPSSQPTSPTEQQPRRRVRHSR